MGLELDRTAVEQSIVSKTPGGVGCEREGMPDYFAAMELQVRRLDALHDAERAFVDLYGDSSHAFWLDSSSARGERARFSFIGAADGPLGAFVSYDVDAGEVRVERGGEVEVVRESIFDYLGRETRRLRRPAADLPFDFDCGFVGYLGYELKAACDGDAAHEAPTPDAAFVFADRLVAFDHLERRTYVLCVTDPDGAAEGGGGSRRRADDWRRCPRSPTLGRWRGRPTKSPSTSTSAAPASAISTTSTPASGACSGARHTRSA